MQPLVFEPVLKRTRWGGRKLGTLLNKPLQQGDDYAESWEICDQPDGQSIVASGRFAGKTLHELIVAHGPELLGRHSAMQQFPLLIKFLDAHDWLSLQVHPNDGQAARYAPNERGKTEAWVILAAEPDSQICAGLKQGVSRSDFESHLHAGTIEETLHMISARPGDCVFIPAQTVHALGPGIVLAEIQQQSNLTFRLHDWGRVGSDGQPREIHVQESLACIDFERGPVNPVAPVVLSDGQHHFEELVRCDFFVIRRHTSVDEFQLKQDDRFRILMQLEGSAQLFTEDGEVPMRKGTTVLVPAVTQVTCVRPDSRTVLLEILHP
ncbi:MAG: class I mannose-6-phosphate isomerase [Fuerstiella sp.]